MRHCGIRLRAISQQCPSYCSVYGFKNYTFKITATSLGGSSRSHSKVKSGAVAISMKTCNAYLSSYPWYFREPHWFSMGLLEISRVTWQVWLWWNTEMNVIKCFIKNFHSKSDVLINHHFSYLQEISHIITFYTYKISNQLITGRVSDRHGYQTLVSMMMEFSTGWRCCPPRAANRKKMKHGVTSTVNLFIRERCGCNYEYIILIINLVTDILSIFYLPGDAITKTKQLLADLYVTEPLWSEVNNGSSNGLV